MMKVRGFVKLSAVISLYMFSSGVFAAQASEDPWETYNRSVYRFNQTVDQILLKPAAKTYNSILPAPVKKGVTHFFDNLNELPSLANNVLQGNIQQAASTAWRFTLNSTLGILGLFDIASHIGLQKYPSDFGITLQRWGIKPTPYFILPLLGPSTVADALAIPVDFQFNALNYVKPKSMTYGGLALNSVDKRAALLRFGSADDVSLDAYVFQRNAYLQQRAAMVDKAKGNTDNDLTAGYDFAGG